MFALVPLALAQEHIQDFKEESNKWHSLKVEGQRHQERDTEGVER